MLSAGCATLLATVTVLGIGREGGDRVVVYVSAIWWCTAALGGILLGRRADASPPIARLLADARSQTTLPEMHPVTTLLNRLWPLVVVTIAASALGIVAPQIPAIAAGFAAIWALSWRRQEAAVTAIEERDGVQFYVEPTSPFRAIRLVRVPGFRRIAPPSLNGGPA